MNHDDPDLGGDWPVVPDEPVGPMSPGCQAGLIVAICAAVLVIATAMAVFGARGCG